MSSSDALVENPRELRDLDIQSSSTSPSHPDNNNSFPSFEPPNGGAAAWLKVLGCFSVFVSSWGVASSFGAYQSFYQTDMLSDYSPSTISWIGTVQVFLLGITGVFAGPLCDRGFVRSLLGVGCSLVVFGLFMLSLSTKFYQIILSQGICIGIGSGLIYVPGVSIVSKAFTTKRPLALGLAGTGSAVGSTILPIMFRHLIPRVGFAWVNRIFGFMILIMSVLAITFLRSDPRHEAPRRHHSFFDAKALKEPLYLFFCAGLFCVELGYWVPPFMITPYAELSLHTSANFAFYLLAIMNASGLVGRILPAYVAQIWGPAAVLVAVSLSLGALILSWLGIHNVAGITVWSILVGFVSGSVVTLPNAVVPRLSPLYSVVGARTGMLWSFVAFAALIGSPIAGALVDKENNDYQHGQIFSGLSICLGAALLSAPAINIARNDRKNR